MFPGFFSSKALRSMSHSTRKSESGVLSVMRGTNTFAESITTAPSKLLISMPLFSFIAHSTIFR